MTMGNRKVGLGVMGFADMLIKLGVPYDSDEALAVGQEVMSFLREESVHTSSLLARERGPFPNCAASVFSDNGNIPRRNATTTTIAPTVITSYSIHYTKLYEKPVARGAIRRLGHAVLECDSVE